MDPLTSLSLVANIVQIVDFGIKAVARGRELAGKGHTKEQAHLEALSRETDKICESLSKPVFVNIKSLEHESDQKKKDPPSPKPGQQDDTCPSVIDNTTLVEVLATKTQGVARELNAMLMGLKVVEFPAASNSTNGPRKRKRDVGKGLVKAIWHDSDLRDLRQKLVDLQQVMILSLAAMQSQTSGEILQAMGDLSRKLETQRSEKLSRLEGQHSDLLARVNKMAGSMDQGGTVDVLSRSLEAMSLQARRVNTCIHVLETLRFEEIHAREEGIAETHTSTFDWVFARPELGFTDWLASKNGMFWITGKPGSGKSTLMKHIVRHPTTTQLLKKWSGGHEVVVSHHFFWNAGTPMQQSRLGFLRTLVYHILYHSPEFAFDHIPPRFHQGGGIGIIPWTLPELRKTLEGFGKQPSVRKHLCIFIDGLDEYKDDHNDLIDLIHGLSQWPTIKICVSSRPWNVFSCAYDKQCDGQFAVQDLTAKDIWNYTNDSMCSNPFFGRLRTADEGRCDALIQSVCEKAQGVFLWVRLVVRSLLRGLSNDDDLDVLKSRLDEYPETLNGYFRRMFSRIEKLYHKQSSRILLVALRAGKPLPLSAPRCLDLELSSHRYALDLPIRDHLPPNVPSLVRWDSGAMEASNRYIDARCAELLERSGNDSISFLHRTARDFLEQPAMLELLAEQAGADFDIHTSIARLTLARIKQHYGDGDSLGSLIREFLALEQKFDARHIELYREMLDDLDANGPAIFHVHDNPVSFFNTSMVSVEYISSSKGAYSESLHAFEISATLIRLRDHRQKSTCLDNGSKGDEESDAQLLFGPAVFGSREDTEFAEP